MFSFIVQILALHSVDIAIALSSQPEPPSSFPADFRCGVSAARRFFPIRAVFDSGVRAHARRGRRIMTYLGAVPERASLVWASATLSFPPAIEIVSVVLLIGGRVAVCDKRG